MNNRSASRWGRRVAALTLLPLASACGILDVDAPGRIADEDLNSVEAVPGIVTGMSYDLAQAIDATNIFTALASGELWHGGSYDWADVPRGIILDEDVNGEWGSAQQARWVAESGLERMKTIENFNFETSPLTARAYLLAGFANRLLGENMCQAVIDGSGAESNTVFFERARGHFSEAIRIGQGAAKANDIVTAAFGGRASVRAWTGDWSGAVEDAKQVPDGFIYYAFLDLENGNEIYDETFNRFEYTVFNTLFVDYPDDPRAPWEIKFKPDGTIATGANGATPHYQQQKYVGLGDDIPLVKGPEMLLLRAEAALRNDDVATAVSLMNQARAEYGMEPISTPASLRDAYTTLHYERGATLWLESRRLWDERRWFEAGPGAPAYNGFLEGRDKCLPISENEKDSNPNLGG